ncbi:MAG: hypothetical protein J5524_07265 [Bacteroidaceae bacterium]|nr:hypothetical protein [Bacteroidaceae bacterium]
MKKDRLVMIGMGLCGIIFMWSIFLLIPFYIKHSHTDDEIVNYMNVSFTAATALFTGIAFAVAYISLYQQSKSLNRQIDYNVFSDTIRLIMDSDKFLLCRQYVFSKDYYRDIEELKRVIKNYNDSIGQHDVISTNAPNLKDFRKVIRNIDEICPLVNRDIKKRLCKSYEKIIIFCGRMEYLGFMCEKNVAVSLILDYYAGTIKESYCILKSLIEENGNGFYVHYTHLFNLARVKGCLDINS